MLRVKMEESIKSQEINSAPASKLHKLFERLDTESTQVLYNEGKKPPRFLLNTKFYGLISQNLSLMGVLEYKLNNGSYKTALNMLEDAKFLAENARDLSAQKINFYSAQAFFRAKKILGSARKPEKSHGNFGGRRFSGRQNKTAY